MLWARDLITPEMAYKFSNNRGEMKSKLDFAAANKDDTAKATNRRSSGLNEILGR